MWVCRKVLRIRNVCGDCSEALKGCQNLWEFSKFSLRKCLEKHPLLLMVAQATRLERE